MNLHTIPQVREIQAVVARHYGIDLLDMKSDRREISVCRPRQIAMYLSRHLTTRSLPEIGSRFGGRDHATVMHAIKRIDQLRLEDEDMDFTIADLSRRIKAQHQHALRNELIGWMA